MRLVKVNAKDHTANYAAMCQGKNHSSKPPEPWMGERMVLLEHLYADLDAEAGTYICAKCVVANDLGEYIEEVKE